MGSPTEGDCCHPFMDRTLLLETRTNNQHPHTPTAQAITTRSATISHTVVSPGRVACI